MSKSQTRESEGSLPCPRVLLVHHSSSLFKGSRLSDFSLFFFFSFLRFRFTALKFTKQMPCFLNSTLFLRAFVLACGEAHAVFFKIHFWKGRAVYSGGNVKFSRQTVNFSICVCYGRKMKKKDRERGRKEKTHAWEWALWGISPKNKTRH